MPFVETWSGGISAHMLRNLESYERTLTVRKKLSYETLETMSRLSYHGLHYYVPAMVKACLNSPVCDQDGTSTLFNTGDIMSVSPTGKNREHAVAANTLMQQCHEFINAYAKPGIVKSVAMSKF